MEKLQVTFGGFSSQGCKEENQDAFAALLPEGELLNSKGATAVVADGVSVCSRGREAAITCVTSFIRDYNQTSDTLTVKSAASQVLHSLNRWCHGQHEYAQGGHSQMITTLSSMIFKSTSGFIFHTGDSRICRLQNGLFEQLTTDHNTHMGTNRVLTRAIGIEPHLDVDFSRVDLCQGDLFLLSTDGMHEFVSAKELRQTLMQWQDEPSISLEALATSIVETALANGSNDNVSCLLVQVETLPQADLNEIHRHMTRLAMPPELEIGMKLEDYRVLDVLFNGTRSSLYKVINERDGQVYGLKTPSQNFVDDPIYLSGFVREEWVGKRIKHPCVMKIYARPTHAKFMYHVCEYIQGQTLRQWMLDHPKPSILQVRSIIGQLVKAARAMQRQNMVHRDIKPENVMITANSEVKLIDFGTVFVEALAETHGQLEEKIPLGALHYIAPEYALGQLADHRSDLFSIAVLCYEMLCNQLPFKLNQQANILPKRMDEWQYTSLRKYRSDLPQWLDLALEKALRANPKSRYQSYSEFLLDISQPNWSMLNATQSQPLIERNPLLLYQLICVIQFIVICILLIW